MGASPILVLRDIKLQITSVRGTFEGTKPTFHWLSQKQLILILIVKARLGLVIVIKTITRAPPPTIETLLCARHCFQHIMCSFNSLKNPMR